MESRSAPSHYDGKRYLQPRFGNISKQSTSHAKAKEECQAECVDREQNMSSGDHGVQKMIGSIGSSSACNRICQTLTAQYKIIQAKTKNSHKLYASSTKNITRNAALLDGFLPSRNLPVLVSGQVEPSRQLSEDERGETQGKAPKGVKEQSTRGSTIT